MGNSCRYESVTRTYPTAPAVNASPNTLVQLTSGRITTMPPTRFTQGKSKKRIEKLTGPVFFDNQTIISASEPSTASAHANSTPTCLT